MFMIYGSRQLFSKLPDVRLSLTEWALTRNSRHQILKTVSSFMSSPAQISSVKHMFDEDAQIKIDYFVESAPYGFLFTSRKTLETSE